jgi:alpha-tubulin suppressor-like RCC1 family protein
VDSRASRERAPRRPRSSPLEVAVLGRAHACARRGDGTLSCWGQNRSGQLGDGTFWDRAQPVTPPVRDVIALAAGANHTCAITRAAALWCWGANNQGQLGIPAEQSMVSTQSTPRMVLANVAEVAAGADHTCARTDRRRGLVLGRNTEGQLGDGTTMRRLTPTRVTLPPGLLPRQLGLGFAHTCVRGADGAVWCWGRNDQGQIGDGTRVARLVPTRAAIGGAEELAVAGDYVLVRQAGRRGAGVGEQPAAAVRHAGGRGPPHEPPDAPGPRAAPRAGRLPCVHSAGGPAGGVRGRRRRGPRA